MKVSIGQAWDEAKAVFQADGRAIFAVALALTVLPGAILETYSPSSLRTSEAPWWIAVLGFVAALLSLVSQVAVSRIALGHQATVGEILAHAFRRLPALIGALFLVIFPFALAISLLAMPLGNTLDPAAVPLTVSLPVLGLALAGIYVLIRMMFLTPLAADKGLGPVALLREAWALSRGRFLKLLGLVLLLMLVGLLLLGALGGALSAVAILAFGALAPGSLSALLVALVQQCLAALVSVLFVVVACRLYRQAEGADAGVSVPNAGGD